MHTTFTETLRDSLDSLRLRLAAATSCAIELHYGATDDGAEHWAALTVEELPEGSLGRPGLLVSILAGPGIPGYAVIMAADFHTTVCTMTSDAHAVDGLRIAEAEALQRFAELAEGSELVAA